MKIIKGIISVLIGFAMLFVGPIVLINWHVASLGWQVFGILIYGLGIAIIWLMWRRK